MLKKKEDQERSQWEMELMHELSSDFCLRQTVLEMKADGLLCLSVVWFCSWSGVFQL